MTMQLLLLLLLFTSAASDPHWLPATATWYGSPEGDGSDGGACGYGSMVDVRPYKAHDGAVSPVLFKNGEGCGACYKVRCLDSRMCSRRAATIIVTDECPGGYCSGGKTHFDLSGAAFGRMAVSGYGSNLRNKGEIQVVYRRELARDEAHMGCQLVHNRGTFEGTFLTEATTLSTKEPSLQEMSFQETGLPRQLTLLA
ncbi:Expansin-B16 [Acorus calamus]|uniref:Expansin-B16 n=1 Tax=Acorus calamus TaxID=4465 RepID=A0AAV9CKQ9_ACOCL|nr:Expansin-B16 [Acorus calamus]